MSRPADDGAASLSVCVPVAKVHLGDGKVVVQYVLRVRYEDLRWDLPRRFSEVKEFHSSISGRRPSLPPYTGRFWRANRQWALIERRRAALDVYFKALVVEASTKTRAQLLSFLQFRWQGMLTEVRGIDPAVSSAVTWHPQDDLAALTQRVSTAPAAALPPGVELCTSSASMASERCDAGTAMRLTLRIKVGQSLKSLQLRERVAEACLLYGWASGQGGRVPEFTEAFAFLNSAATKKAVHTIVVEGCKRRRPLLQQTKSDSANSLFSAASELENAGTLAVFDTPEYEIHVSPPPHPPAPPVHSRSRRKGLVPATHLCVPPSSDHTRFNREAIPAATEVGYRRLPPFARAQRKGRFVSPFSHFERLREVKGGLD